MDIAEEALADGSENGTLLWNAGWARFRLGLPAETIDYLRRAVDAEPTKATNPLGPGRGLSRSGQEDRAELRLLLALALRDSALGRLSLANNYRTQGLDDVAEAVHKEGLSLSPRSRYRVEAYADLLSDMQRDGGGGAVCEAKNLRDPRSPHR